MWKKKHTQTIKQDCWSLCVGVKEIETYQKLYAFGTCIREGAFSFPTSLQWHSIWRIIPLSNTLVTMVIHHLCMITRRMRTCHHLINHLRYMGWATKYRLKSLVQQPPGSPAENVIQHPDKRRCKWCGRFLPKRRRRLAEMGRNISWVPFWSPFRIQNHVEVWGTIELY